MSQATKQPAPVLRTEDGDTLEIVGDNEMPEIYDEMDVNRLPEDPLNNYYVARRA